MGADTTLVNAAFREAESRGKAMTPDLSKLYQSTMDISKQSLGIVATAMLGLTVKEEKKKLGVEKQLKGFRAIAKNGLKMLYEQQQPLPNKIVFAIKDEIKRLQAEFEKFNTYGKEDTDANEEARIQIEGALGRLINEAKDTRENFMKMFGSMENLNTDEIQLSDGLVAQEQTIDLPNMDTNDGVSVSVVDGRLTYKSSNYYSDATSSWGDAYSMNMDDMIKALPTKNLQWDIDFGENKKEIPLKAMNDGEIYDFDMAAETSRIANTINTEEEFQGVATRRIANTGELSFKESLLNNPNIPISVIQNMFIDDNGERMDVGLVFAELDKNGDGIITEVDGEGLESNELTNFENNVLAMVDALTNIDNPAFSLAISKPLFSQYYAEVNESTYRKLIDKNIEKGENARRIKTEKTEKTSNYLDTSMGSISKVRAENYVNKIQNSEKEVRDLRGNDWELQADGRYKTKYAIDEGGNFEYRTREQMMSQQDMDAFYPDIYKGILDETATTTAAKEKWNPGKVVKAGDYKPFEGSDGNLISDQQLEVVGKLEDGSIEVRLPDGRVETMSRPGL